MPRIAGPHQKREEDGRVFPWSVQESVALPTTGHWTSASQNWASLHFCFLKPPAWDTLLRQLEKLSYIRSPVERVNPKVPGHRYFSESPLASAAQQHLSGTWHSAPCLVCPHHLCPHSLGHFVSGLMSCAPGQPGLQPQQPRAEIHSQPWVG